MIYLSMELTDVSGSVTRKVKNTLATVRFWTGVVSGVRHLQGSLIVYSKPTALGTCVTPLLTKHEYCRSDLSATYINDIM